MCDDAVFDSYLAFFRDRYACGGFVWSADCVGGYGAHDDTGYLKYRGRDEYHTKHRNHAAFRKLRGDVRCLFVIGNGACVKRVINGTIDAKR